MIVRLNPVTQCKSITTVRKSCINEALIEDVQMLCKGKTKLFLIGEKNFGENNGQVYRHRFAKDYHQLTIEMEEGYAEKNKRLKAAYPDIYIDMITPSYSNF